MTLTLLSVAGHLSFGLTAFSFYVRDMLVLRCLAIASCLVGIGYNYWLPAGPLWLVIFWLTVFIGINGTRIAGIVMARRAVSFSPEEAELFDTIFREFTPVEFMKLLRIGEWRDVKEGHRFSVQGQNQRGLKLLYNGEVVVERDGAEIARARDGAMLGEMAFIQGGPATATVTASRPCRYLFWDGPELRALLNRNPTMDVAMKHVFSMDLTRKLAA